MYGKEIHNLKFVISSAEGQLFLKDYLKTLNNSLDGYNIDFFEDEKESIWMMANAYYKLISDFAKKESKSRTEKKKKKWR